MAKMRFGQRRLAGRRSRGKRQPKGFAAVRALDAGKGNLPYDLNRGLEQAVFKDALVKAIVQRIKTGGRIIVLDKGAGTGRMAADVKRINQEKIFVTAWSLTDTFAARNRKLIDDARIGPRLRLKPDTQFDVIYDHMGKDYHLSKHYIWQSMVKSISLLKRHGHLFVVIPLVYRESRNAFTIKEGIRLVMQLAQRKDLTVRCEKLPKRFEKIEFIDMVLHVRKK